MRRNVDEAQAFAALHRKGDPLILYNCWDAGSAQAVAAAGAEALATASWAVAASQGYADGEEVPLDDLIRVVTRISATTRLPLTVDFEGGYATAPGDVARNVERLIEAGAIGLNLEDQIVGGVGLHPIAEQVERIAAVRLEAERKGLPLFVNARTDLFLQEKDPSRHGALLEEAIARGQAYSAAGADGFFVPALVEPESIRTICERVSLPVNVMKSPTAPTLSALARLGVARVSYGPFAYRAAMAGITEAASSLR